MAEPDDIETRLRKLERFVNEVRGGRRLLLYICSGIGVLLGLVLTFWDRLSGSTQ